MNSINIDENGRLVMNKGVNMDRLSEIADTVPSAQTVAENNFNYKEPKFFNDGLCFGDESAYIALQQLQAKEEQSMVEPASFLNSALEPTC